MLMDFNRHARSFTTFIPMLPAKNRRNKSDLFLLFIGTELNNFVMIFTECGIWSTMKVRVECLNQEKNTFIFMALQKNF